MLMLSRHRLFLRCVSLLTALTFLPNSVDAWYFIPQVQAVVLAAEEGPVPLAPDKVAELTTGTQEPVPLREQQRIELVENLAPVVVDMQTSDFDTLHSSVGEPSRHATGTADPVIGSDATFDENSRSRLVSNGTATLSGEKSIALVALATGTEKVATNEGLPPVPQHRAAWAPEGLPQVVQARFNAATKLPLFQATLGADPLLEAVPTVIAETPVGLAAALADAQALWQGGQGAEAFIATVQLAESYPNIQWNEVVTARNLGDEIAMTANGPTHAAIESAIPGLLSTLSSSYGKECAARYYEIRAELLGGPAVPAARPYLEKLRDAHWQIVQQHPNELIGHFKIRTYLKVCEDLGELAEGEERLWSAVNECPPSLVAFSSWNYFAEKASSEGAYGQSILCYANVLEMAKFGVLDPILNNANTSQTSKAARLFVLARALEFTGKLEEALAQYRYIEQNFSDPPDRWGMTKDVPVLLSGLLAARLEAKLKAGDPYAGILAYNAFIQRNPTVALAGQAMLEMAGVYLRAGDYHQAAAYYGHVIETYAGSEAAVAADHELSYVLENLYEAMEVASGPGVPTAESVQIAQNCGPMALQRMLAFLGVVADEAELGELAGTNSTGTSMQGLIRAASAKGVKLLGVSAKSPERLRMPFIAFVRDDHFVLVTASDKEKVTVADLNEPPSVLLIAEFSAMWGGEALVIAGKNIQHDGKIEVARLEAARGGTSGGGPPTPPMPPIEDGGMSMGAISTLPTSGTMGASTISNPMPGSDYGRTGGGIPGWMNGGAADANFGGEGVRASIHPSVTGLSLNEDDLGIGVRGANSLGISRTFYSSGYHNPDFASTGQPWSNNMGAGWTHSLNMHLRTSVPVGGKPSTVIFYDATGSARTYTYASTSGGFDWYDRSVDGSTGEKSYSITRDTSSGIFTVQLPSGGSFVFSAPTGSPNYFARLETIRDGAPTPNEIDLDYNGAVGTGRLTKATGPEGIRNLLFSYSGSLITKIELRKSSTVLQHVEYRYNNVSELTNVTDQGGANVQYYYAANGSAAGSRFLTKITDKQGIDATLVWTFTLNGLSQYEASKVELTNVNGLRTSYERSLVTGVTTILNKNTPGSTTYSKFVYTPAASNPHRPQYQDQYLGNLSTYERWSYEFSGADLTKANAPGSKTWASYSYTGEGRLSTATGMDNNTAKFEYAASDPLRPTKRVNLDGTENTFNYDAYGFLISMSVPYYGNGVYETYQYDSFGQLTSSTTAQGNTLAHSYDDFGQLTAITDMDSNTATMEYDDFGLQTKNTDYDGRDTYNQYAYKLCGGCGGRLGQLTKTVAPDGSETRLEYDAFGRQTKVVPPAGEQTTTAYDGAGRQTLVTPSSGEALNLIYNLLGQQVTKTKGLSNSKDVVYDHMGRVTRKTENGATVTYTYDSFGKVSTITDAGGKVWTNFLDSALQLTKVASQGGSEVHFWYDDKSRRTKIGAGAAGAVDPITTYYNTDTGIATRMRYRNGGTDYDVDSYYDTGGRLTKLKDWLDGVNAYRYYFDAKGFITRFAEQNDDTVEYAYDGRGRLTSLTDQQGDTRTYGYDDLDRRTTVTAPGSKTWTNYFGSEGQLTKVALPNGISMQNYYDAATRLTKIGHMDGGSALESFTFGFNSQAVITRITNENDSVWDYFYDSLNRLTKGERYDTDGTTLLARFAYVYDASMNMTSKTVYDPAGPTTTTTQFFYDLANQLTKGTVGGTDTTFAYDAWGRMTSKTDGTYSATYTYRYGSKLYSATSDFPGEEDVSYEYNGLGFRISRTVNGVTTKFRYTNSGELVATEDDGGNLLTSHIERLADCDAVGGDYEYFAVDHLGSIRGRYDESKAATGTYEYTPYGEIYAQSGASLSWGFTGHMWDEASDLYDSQTRSYSPALGRWISVDPAGMIDGTNLYAYVGGNPIMLIDPKGTVGTDFRFRIFGCGATRTELMRNTFYQTAFVDSPLVGTDEPSGIDMQSSFLFEARMKLYRYTATFLCTPLENAQALTIPVIPGVPILWNTDGYSRDTFWHELAHKAGWHRQDSATFYRPLPRCDEWMPYGACDDGKCDLDRGPWRWRA